MDAVISLAGGLVLPFMVLSLFVMLLVEIWSRAFRWREKILQNSIERMIGNFGSDVRSRFLEHPLLSSLHARGSLPAYIPSRLFAKAFVNFFGEDSSKAAPVPENRLNVVFRSLDKEATAEATVISVHDWFADVMDQASGAYRVKTLRCVFVLTSVIVLAANFDAFQIANHAVHKSLVEKAFEEDLKDLVEHHSSDPVQTVDVLRRQISLENATEKQMSFPIGWQSNPDEPVSSSPRVYLSKIGGLITSILAVMIGAPFLFDLLNRYMVVRLAIKPFDGT
jgi:hypothetical protein